MPTAKTLSETERLALAGEIAGKMFAPAEPLFEPVDKESDDPLDVARLEGGQAGARATLRVLRKVFDLLGEGSRWGQVERLILALDPNGSGLAGDLQFVQMQVRSGGRACDPHSPASSGPLADLARKAKRLAEREARLQAEKTSALRLSARPREPRPRCLGSTTPFATPC